VHREGSGGDKNHKMKISFKTGLNNKSLWRLVAKNVPLFIHFAHGGYIKGSIDKSFFSVITRRIFLEVREINLPNEWCKCD
jgi:hypothetical protein